MPTLPHDIGCKRCMGSRALANPRRQEEPEIRTLSKARREGARRRLEEAPTQAVIWELVWSQLLGLEL